MYYMGEEPSWFTYPESITTSTLNVVSTTWAVWFELMQAVYASILHPE